MNFDPSIFKAYDIRGIYGQNLNEDTAYKVACAYAVLLKKETPKSNLKVVVGQDMRVSTPSLKEKIIAGLTDSGIDVIDIGLVTTPTYYFAVAYYGYDGGIQVSASHNPKEWNGFKIVRAGAVPMGGDTGIYQLRDMVHKGLFERAQNKGTVIEKKGVVKEEVKIQREGINWQKINPFKIAVDTGNGMGSLDVEAIFEGLPCKLTKLNFKLDGTFPVHIPDPLKEETLEWLKKAVVSEKCDLGIATDGDGDRWFFIDEKGQTVPQPILRGLMAQIELKDSPGATVCYDIRPGRITKEMIEAAGGNAVVTKVGHSLIKEKMIEKGAIFGGESSGHYFYKFSYGTFEAPIVLCLKFLSYLSEKKTPLSEIVAPYKKYFHSGEINKEVDNKEQKMEEIVQKYNDGKVSRLDGITIEYPDFWFNVRTSNTESVLRFALEAKTQKLMQGKKDEVIKLIEKN